MDKINDFNYEEFLKGFINNDYKFVFFDSLDSNKKEIILRHDVDFDCELAWELAKIENSFGIKANYFFLLFNDAYNPFCFKNIELIKKIKKMGHQISLHFDPSIYGDDFKRGLLREISLFEEFFETKIKIISIHKPNDFFIKSNSLINGIEHTYLDKYFSKIKYLSDSTGRWRFGYPLDSIEFKEGKSFQILIHPIWWFFSNDNNLQKIENLFEYKNNRFKEMIQKNYPKILENYGKK